MSKFAYVALACAAMSLVVSAPAMAQDAAMTSGGDVTAQEATPLPPVVVEAPSQPLARKKKQQTTIGSAGSAPAATTPQQGPATSGEAPGTGSGTAGVGIYTLGQLDMIGGSTVTNEAMWTFNKNTVDQAVSIVPGVMHGTGRRPPSTATAGLARCMRTFPAARASRRCSTATAPVSIRG